jgi:hypothetical protein
MSDELVKKVTDWLDGQGFPLEMRVARAFFGRDFYVSLSEIYEDPDTSKPREIDVLASRSHVVSGVSFEFLFTVECKFSRKKPWVTLSSIGPRRIAPTLSFHARVASTIGEMLLQELSSLRAVESSPLFSLGPRPAHGVVEAFRDSNEDTPFKALNAAYHAARAAASHLDHVRTPAGNKQFVAIVFPLVVLDGRLFDAYLDQEASLKVEERGWQVVVTKRIGRSPFYSILHLVTEAALPEFLDQASSSIDECFKAIPGETGMTLQRALVSDLVEPKR